MATYKRTYSNGNTPSGTTTKFLLLTNASDSQNNICPNIPDYSILTDVIVYWEWRTDKSLTSGDCRLYTHSVDSNYLTGEKYPVGDLSQAKNSWTGVKRTKTDRIRTGTGSISEDAGCLVDYFSSGKKEVGKYTGTRNVGLWFSATISRNFYWRNVYMEFVYTPPTYKISLTAGAGGEVSGAGTYEVGSTATIKATPYTGYKFVKWSDGNRDAERKITITESNISANVTNLSYTATFEKIKYDVVFKNHDGTILQSSQVEHGSTPSYTGTTPTKPSTAEYSYSFSGWSPSIGAVTSATTYTAQFTATVRKYTVSTAVSPSEGGTVAGADTYEYGKSATLTAKANSGYTFSQWNDGVKTNPRTVTVTGAATYTAIFEQMSRIILDENRAKGFLLDTNKVKGILIDNTKIY